MAMYPRMNVSSPMLVVCLEAVFETGTSLTEKADQERKKSQNVYALILRVLSCVLQTGKVKLFLEVEMKRECCLWKLKCEKE